MKIRNGFISNSSSSSFIIDTKELTDEQVNMILNHYQYAQEMDMIDSYCNEYDAWSITFDDDNHSLTGYTSMDNFSMYNFFLRIGVDCKKVNWEHNG
jgi:hypothetical protein